MTPLMHWVRSWLAGGPARKLPPPAEPLAGPEGLERIFREAEVPFNPGSVGIRFLKAARRAATSSDWMLSVLNAGYSPSIPGLITAIRARSAGVLEEAAQLGECNGYYALGFLAQHALAMLVVARNVVGELEEQIYQSGELLTGLPFEGGEGMDSLLGRLIESHRRCVEGVSEHLEAVQRSWEWWLGMLPEYEGFEDLPDLNALGRELTVLVQAQPRAFQ